MYFLCLKNDKYKSYNTYLSYIKYYIYGTYKLDIKDKTHMLDVKYDKY